MTKIKFISISKICVVSLPVFSAVLTAGAQSLQGRVLLDDQPLPAALVSVKGRGKVLTDSAGYFTVPLSGTGACSLSLSGAGAQPLDTLLQPLSGTVCLIRMRARESPLDEVVVTATMRPVHKGASPIPVELYTPAYFRKNPSPSLFEALQLVNGVQPQLNCNVCNAGDIHINGMEGPYSMVLIDGMPIVSSLSTVYGLSGIPEGIIRRVEIVKGPASTLYGSEAIGGMINIITRDARSAPRFKMDLSATGIGEYNTEMSSGFRIGKTEGLLGLNGFDFSRRRDINQDQFTDLALVRRFSVFNKWQHAFSERVQSSLALRLVHENRWGGELHWQPRFRGGAEVYGEQVLTRRVELISNTRWQKGWDLDISWNRHRQQSWYGTTVYAATQQVAFVQLRRTFIRGRHTLLAGLPLRYSDYDDNTPATAGYAGSNRPDHIYLPGLFLQDEWDLRRGWLLLAGLRYDYNNRHGSILTPRLSMKYSTPGGQVFRLSMGNGYRVVNLFTEDHAALTGAREVVIAARLRPEQSWNLNLNYSGTLRFKNGFAGIDMTLFMTRFSNRIVPDYLTDARKIIYDNLNGYALSRGFTLNTNWHFGSGLRMIAGFTLLDVFQASRDSSGRTRKTNQVFAPAFSGTFTLSYPVKKWMIDLSGRVMGPMALPVVPGDFRPAQSPWFGLLNLQLSGPLAKQLEWYAGIKNLLNFIPRHPLLHPDDPFNRPGGKYFDEQGQPRPDTNPHGYRFDPSYNYAPVQGAKWFTGLRWQLPG